LSIKALLFKLIFVQATTRKVFTFSLEGFHE